MNEPQDERLVGWKAIGNFVGRDARTARRWEAERGLPVHRVPGGGSATVWADRAELTTWLASADREALTSAPDSEATAASRRFSPRGLAALAAGAALIAASPLLISAWGSSGAAHAQPAQPYGTDVAANSAYQTGVYAMSRRSVAGLTDAERIFSDLAQRKPRNAAAFVGLAETNLLLREFNSLPDETAYRRASMAAQHALALDPHSAGALRALGFVKYWSDGRRAEGLSLFRQAIAAAPDDAQSLHWYGSALLGEGRFAESLAVLQRASALEPGSSAINADMAYVQFAAGQRAEGISALERITTIDPAFSGAHAYLERIHLIDGNTVAYLTEAAESARLKRDAARMEMIARAKAAFDRGGRTAMLDQLISDARHAFEQNGRTALDLARYSAARGDRAGVLHWLEQADSVNQPEIRSLVAYPDFAPYRDDPAFQRFFNHR